MTSRALVVSLCSSRVMQSSRDSVDGRTQRVFQFRALLSLLLAPQEFDLNQAHGIDIRVAQANRAGQHAIACQQFALAADRAGIICRERRNSSSSMVKTRFLSAAFLTSPE